MIIFSNSTSDIDVRESGGKAKNLHVLSKVPNIIVPKWFCIPTSFFGKFIQDSIPVEFLDKLKALLKDSKKNEEQIISLIEEIKKTIMEATLDTGLKMEIELAYEQLIRALDGEHKLAIRSSGTTEDSEKTSLAGIHDSLLNISGFDNVLHAIKTVWASAFNIRAVIEKANMGDAEIESIAVVVQQMITAKFAGTALSIELSSNYPGIDISANYGTGETVVSGEISTDRWLVHETKPYIIKAVLGDKAFKSVPDADGGMLLEPTPKVQQAIFTLDNQQVLEIADYVKKIKQSYGCDVDTEFAIDDKGKVYFVQVRPVVKMSTSNAMIIDPEVVSTAKVLAKGLYSTPGVIHGTLRFVETWEELTAAEHDLADQIIVTYKTSNVWSHYITQAKGLITKEGSPTSHPILLARERGIPCIIGIHDNFEALVKHSGNTVTLDPLSKTIYEGELVLKIAEPVDLEKAFLPVSAKPLLSLKTKIEEFRKSNMVFFQDNRYWLKTPTYVLKKFEQQVNLKRFELFTKLVGLGKPVNVPNRIIDNYVCNILDTFDTVVGFFSGMSISQSSLFVRDQEASMREYLEATANFSLNPEAWLKYVNAYTKFRAHIWLGGGFRAFIEKQIEIEAIHLELPQHYLDECYTMVQATLIEEDSLMQQAVFDFATKLLGLPGINTLEELESSYPEHYAKLRQLGEKFRFQHNISLHVPLDMDLVFKKVLSAKQQLISGAGFVNNKIASREIFFPDNEKLLKLINLSMHNRVNQSNAHHYHIRGQWNVRKELLQLGEYMFQHAVLGDPNEVFDLDIASISSAIEDYSRELRNRQSYRFM